MQRRAVLAAGLASVLVVGAGATQDQPAAVAESAPAASSIALLPSEVVTAAAPSRAAPSLRTSRTLQLRAAMITSTLENSDTTLQYGYAEDIGDGRGITAGRAGFTSATGDLLLVVERYARMRQGAAVVRFLPALRRANGSGSTRGLGGLPAAWGAAAADARFRTVQDDVVEDLYLKPAMRLAERYRVRSPLGQAIIWDTAIQHGIDGRDGLKAILKQTYRQEGYATSGHRTWLRAFLSVRLTHLLHWSEGGFHQSPSASRARISTWRSLVKKKRALTLRVPLKWRAYGDTCSINAHGRGSGRCR